MDRHLSLRLVGIGTDADGDTYKIVGFTDWQGVERLCPVHTSVLAKGQAAVFEQLAKHGYIAPQQSALRAKVIAALDDDGGGRQAWRVANRVGWLDDTFILPGSDVLPKGIVSALPINRSHFAVAGTLREWQEHVAALARGNALPMFAIMAAFAGPLLRLTQSESGGFQFVTETSNGKSSCAIAAGSVWGGGGPNGFADTFLTTANSLDDVAAAYSDTFLILDETGLAGDERTKARTLCDAAYRLASGQSKRRQTDVTRPMTWRILYLSTSEHDLDTLAERAKIAIDGGQRVRHVDILADAGKGLGVFDALGTLPSAAALAECLVDHAKCYYGTAGRAFIKRLCAHRRDDDAALREFLNKRIGRMIKLLNVDQSDGRRVRIARRFALVYAAGRLANEYKILPWKMGEMQWAIATIYERVNWAALRECDPALGLAQLIRDQAQSFPPPTTAAAAAMATGAVMGFKHQRATGAHEYLIRSAALERYAGSKGKLDRLIAALKRRGLLNMQRGNKTTVTRALPGLARQRYYSISARIYDLAS